MHLIGSGFSSIMKAFNLPLGAWLVLLGGAALVGVAIMAQRFLLKRREQGRSRPFLSLVKASAGAVPQAVTDPAKRARLDDLRRNFEGGIEKFRAAGKNLYAIPWYLLVGEPGSGKTEAVRHCGVGFPPGLQDPQQGAGGTLSMNWWFTNHAVILDTAGRLLFEEVEPGSTSEWREFLKILKTARGNCPVNGLLLVIPATSLLKDSSDAIEQKAGKIARQLDTIQRTLDVRFPVFVVVTMADLIPGFRSFFNGIDDPQLQSQLLGWSNPEPLDAAFNPDHVERHLQSVTDRLKRRRLGLLLDPVHSDDPRERRTDQVDELYNFPEALQKLAPRLRRYLELVFVAGEWSPKPLFLRGIYFTSSMREGQELDIDLAEALGVKVETLPGGKVWDRERAYFLRDVFMSKVFREKGLVTRASSVTRQQRRRRLTLLGASSAVILTLLGLTWYFGGQFSRTVGEESAFWASTSRVLASNPPAVLDTAQGSYTYVGDVGVKEITPGPVTRDELPAEAMRRAEKRINIPAVFRPFAAVSGSASGDLKKEARREAVRSILEATVLRPAIDAARQSLARRATDAGGAWSPADTRALAELARLRTLAAGEKPAGPPPQDGLIRLAPLFAAVLKDKGGAGPEIDRATAKAAELQAVIEWAYGGENGAPWPPAFVGAAQRSIDEDVSRAISAMAASTATHLESGSTLAALKHVTTEAAAFRRAEEALLEAFGAEGFTPPASAEAFQRMFDAGAGEGSWPALLENLRRAGQRLDAALSGMDGGAGGPAGLSAGSARSAAEALAAQAEAALTEVTLQLPAPGAGPSAGSQSIRAMLEKSRDDLRARIEATAAEVEGGLASLAPVLAATGPGAASGRDYRARLAVYEQAETFRSSSRADTRGSLAGAVEGAAREAEQARAAIADRGRSAADAGLARRAVLASQRVVSAVESSRVSAAIAAHLGAAPADADAVAELVVRTAERLKEDPDYRAERQPDLPLTAMHGQEFDAAFHREAARSVLQEWTLVGVRVASGAERSRLLDVAELSERYQQKSEGFRRYARAYLSYWGDGSADLGPRDRPLLHQLRIAADVRDWKTLMEGVDAINGQEIDLNNQLRALGKRMRAAIDAVPGGLGPDVPAAKSAAREAVDQVLSEEHFVEGYDEKCERMIKFWRTAEFRGGGPGARRQLLNAMAEEVVASRPLAAVVKSGIAYWNDLALRAVTLLADQAEVEARSAEQKLAGAKAPPLTFMECAGSAPALDAAQIADIAAAVASVAGAGTSAEDSVDRRRLPDAIRAQLMRLEGDEFLSRAETRDWIGRLEGVVRALSDRARPVTCEVAMVLDRDPQALSRFSGCVKDARPAIEAGFLFAELRVAGRSAGTRTINPGGDEARSRAFEGPVEASAGPVEIVFKAAERGPDGAKVVLPGPWSLLAAATAGSARSVEVTSDGWWHVPVAVEVKGVAYVQRVAMKFTPALPVPEQWPAASAWPAR